MLPIAIWWNRRRTLRLTVLVEEGLTQAFSCGSIVFVLIIWGQLAPYTTANGIKCSVRGWFQWKYGATLGEAMKAALFSS